MENGCSIYWPIQDLNWFHKSQNLINLKDFMNRISHRNHKSQRFPKSYWEQNQVPQSSEFDTRKVQFSNTMSNKEGCGYSPTNFMSCAKSNQMCELLLIFEMSDCCDIHCGVGLSEKWTCKTYIGPSQLSPDTLGQQLKKVKNCKKEKKVGKSWNKLEFVGQQISCTF